MKVRIPHILGTCCLACQPRREFCSMRELFEHYVQAHRAVDRRKRRAA